MSASSLNEEMDRAGRAVCQVHLDQLRAFGVSNATIARMGDKFWPFGVVDAEPIGGGFYQPGQGVPHLVIPVIEDEVPIDLVAFRSASPDDWLLRTGNGFALGLADGLDRWTWFRAAESKATPPRHQVGCPLHLYNNPLDWLQGGGQGLCVLDWSSPEIRRLAGVTAVTVSDAGTGELLRQAISRPAAMPSINILGGLLDVA